MTPRSFLLQLPASLGTQKWLRQVMLLAAIVLAVGALDWFSLHLSRGSSHVDTLWPSRGLVLAALLLARPGNVAKVLVAATLGAVLGKVASGATVSYAVLGSGISLSGTFLASQLVRRLIGAEFDFRDWQKLVRYFIITTGVAFAIAIPGGAFATLEQGPPFLDNWLRWSLATALSYAVFTPPTVLLMTTEPGRLAASPARKRLLGASLGMLGLVIFVFSQSTFPAGYLVPVGLLIVTLVADIEGTTIALLITAIVATALTALGLGPMTFVSDSALLQINTMQCYLAALTFGMVPTAAAITERRRLRDSLSTALDQVREREEVFRLMAETAPDIVIRTDLSGAITYVAPSVERILGYAPAQMLGLRPRNFIVVDDWSIVAGAVREALESASSRGPQIRYRGLHAGGHEVWLESCPTIARDTAGNVIGVLDIARDVTARKQMEDALLEARRVAEEAAEAKSEFLANMSHELRTPLTTVIGFAEALKEHCNLDPRATHFTDRVRNASRALLSTVTDILDYTKIERGVVDYDPEFIDARAHMLETLDIFAIQAREKGLALLAQCDPALDEIDVFLDPLRLRQVELNLLNNAIKFTNAGSVTLRARLVGRDNREARLRYEVTDTGPGIPADRLDRLFQRFSQVDSRAQALGGAGLGLAICKGIVAAMDGQIGVLTSPGQGSTFWFELPAGIRPAVQPQIRSRA